MKRLFCLLFAFMLMCPAALEGGRAETGLTVVFFGAEAADAILMYDAESAVLIDAGLKKYGERILEYMRGAGIDSLDLMLITHFDKDHVGGAAKVIEGTAVSRILAPLYHVDSKRYTDFLDAAAEAGIEVERVSGKLSAQIGEIRMEIDAADWAYKQENDLSLVTYAQYGDLTLLFAGDAEDDRIRELLLDGVAPCDVIKVPHHGRLESTSEYYINAAAPKYAIVTSSEEEPEDEALIGLLSAYGAETYLTRLGDVVLTYEGGAVSIEQIPAAASE